MTGFHVLAILLGVSAAIDFNEIYEENEVGYNNSFVEKVEVQTIPAPVKTKKKPVKLNLAQNTIMNQVLSIYSLSDSKNSLCRNHSMVFKEDLRAFELWALKMFDASSKLQAGILNGNTMDFGSFRLCVDIDHETTNERIRGKQCVLYIKPSEDIIMKMFSFRGVSEKRYNYIKDAFYEKSLMWTVCVPDSCSAEDVLRHFNSSILRFSEGLDITISLNEIDCYSHIDDKYLDAGASIVIFLVLSLIAFNFICTLFDYLQKESKYKIVKIFSISRNIERFLTRDKNNHELECLDGIRCLCMIYVILGHRFLLSLFYPVVNALYIAEWVQELPSTVIVGGTVSVDTFFMMTGLLVTYYMLLHLSNGGKFNFIKFVLYRYIRLAPTNALFIIFNAILTPYMGSGPIWKSTSKPIWENCNKYWWSALLYIQNYVNPKELCILQTWYMGCDMMYYFISPLLVYPLFKRPKFGLCILLTLYPLSVYINFYLARINNFSASELISANLSKSIYFSEHYIKPHIRSTTFILGVLLGYILFKTRNKTITIPTYLVWLLWISTLIVLAVIILSNNVFQLESYEQGIDASIFISFHRSAWIFANMWMVFACKHGYGGFINKFLSWNFFGILSKLTYTGFLCHMQVIYLTNSASIEPLIFTNFDCIYKFCGDVAISFVIALLVVILFEGPSLQLAKLLK